MHLMVRALLQDDECAKEQMEVQKKYDKQKKPAVAVYHLNHLP